MTDRQDVAIVTGGAQGIGLACAQALADQGARVALWDLDADAMEDALAVLPKGHTATLKVDITDYATVEAALAQTEAELGPVTQMVNSAGIAGPNAVIEEYPIDDWGQILRVNLTGSFHMLRAVLPGMKVRGYGRVVLVASVAGKDGNPNASAYSASKAGVMALAKSAGKECARFDIAVNAITPAAAKTRIFNQMSQEHIDYMLSKIPRERFLKVEEAAAMVSWLCSEQNSFTTGAIFDLSGGRATY
ncbi:MAG: SDR family NAD(P)-dependent oxidoreductase [Pseudomonadota bacterium]